MKETLELVEHLLAMHQQGQWPPGEGRVLKRESTAKVAHRLP